MVGVACYPAQMPTLRLFLESELNDAMNLRRKLRNALLVLLLAAGALIGWETVDVDNGDGNWVRLESQFRFAWEPVLPANQRTNLRRFAGVKVHRWYCYGLSFAHSEYHFPKSTP